LRILSIIQGLLIGSFMKNKIQLSSRIHLYVFAAIVLVASIFMLADMVTEYQEYKEYASKLRHDFLTHQKNQVKQEVLKINEMIASEREMMEHQILESTKPMVLQAHNIASNIYSTYHKTMSETEVKELIVNALKPIRLKDGTQYLFILNTNKGEVLIDNQPDMGEVPFKDYIDPHGNHILKDMTNIVKEGEEGFYTYYWTKPFTEGNDHKKSSYIKIFKPYNWIIGSGVYYEDYKKELQKAVLEKIGKIRFGPDLEGYIFVVSYDGTTLMNDTQRHLIGTNSWDLEDMNGVKVIQEERKAAENPQGGFISYHWPNPKTGEISEKVSFIKGLDDWGWMFGAGFYYDDIEPRINELHDEIYNDRIQELYEYLTIIFFLSVLLIVLRNLFTRRLKNDLAKIVDFFKKAAHEDRLIDTDTIRYQEFSDLAGYANTMLKERIAANNSLQELNEQLNDRVQAEIKKNEKHVQVLHEQKKLADMGQMINAIAHQWRQPLNGISLITQTIKDMDNGIEYQLDRDELYEKHGNLVKYMSNTIDDFRNYFSVNKQKHDFSLSGEIKKTADLLSAQLNAAKIAVEVKQINSSSDSEKKDIFHGSSGEFRQVIMNLLSNAKDAIQDKRISSGLKNEEYVDISIEIKDDEFVVSIYNSGGCIPDEIISKIFNPYFTTKDEGKGTGIGLYLTKTIVEKELRGKITVENNKSGPVFTITLPL